VRQAVMFTFACSFCYIIAHGYVSVFGFLQMMRQPPAAIDG
jgi:hypothetical protein